MSLTPQAYRAKWGLKPDYPMVAPAYSAKRQALAKEIGLGRKPAATAAPEPRAEAQAPGQDHRLTDLLSSARTSAASSRSRSGARSASRW